jgi:hypothetical protein
MPSWHSKNVPEKSLSSIDEISNLFSVKGCCQNILCRKCIGTHGHDKAFECTLSIFFNGLSFKCDIVAEGLLPDPGFQ